MSRVVVKNLPKGTTEDKLRSFLGEGMIITDCSLKFSKSGAFRRFAFVGFKNEEDAPVCVKKFNKSFINTTRISVEVAKELGDDLKPRSWSKYSNDVSKLQPVTPKTNSETNPASRKETKKKWNKLGDEKVEQLFGELADDPEFKEFLDLHKSRDKKTTWSNDAMLPNAEDETTSSNAVKFADDDTSDDDEESKETEKQMVKNKKQNISDLDYLKSKMSANKALLEDSGLSSTSSSDDDGSGDEGETGRVKDNASGLRASDEIDIALELETEVTRFFVKMKGLPIGIKEIQIKDFFRPLVPKSIKIPRNARGSKAFCLATVEFHDAADQELAMSRNKNFVGPKRIYLHKTQVVEKSGLPQNSRPWEEKVYDEARDGELETIAESGRLYVRNLPYCCTPEDLEEKFKIFGPLTETHLPIDKVSKKLKGYAFITFMIPENAVKAYTEMDGKTFQGRLLHVLPGRASRDQNTGDTENMTYKQKQDQKKKAQASSSHNWNSLFLGANAVADVMAEKYDTSKSSILDPTEKQSLGVRMALGETQIVVETRDFLIESGVVLDSFSRPGAARSKTVILVKNLPSATKCDEITELFNKFGTLGRVLLPPSGVTAIVEFLEITEAKTAFRSLAYTKFKHLPLYLEWAPSEVFKSAHNSRVETEPDTTEKDADNKTDAEKATPVVEPSSGCTLFVKNLNFETTDDNFKKTFLKCGKIKTASVSRKKDLKKPGTSLSMGYGFVEYVNKASAEKALKTLQNTKIDGHAVELKISNRDTIQKPGQGQMKRKQQTSGIKPSTKIAIRNIPFEAHSKEIRELFSVFGELKFCRLPKKMSGSGTHRGFGFVEFLTKNDAKRAFETLCHSTHLYGRRIVLEWASEEDSVEELRNKTATYFQDDPASKKFKKSNITDNLQSGSLSKFQ